MGWWRRIGDSPPTDDDMLCTGPLETPCPPMVMAKPAWANQRMCLW
jgi:hypothetical protein